MTGWTRNNRSHSIRLTVFALALVSAALFTSTAAAKPTEIPYLSHGIGVSPPVETDAQFTLDTTGIDPYLQDWNQITGEQTSPSAGQSTGGVTPTNLARAYVQQDEPVATAAGRSFELGDAALGFGLGLLLAAGGAVAIVLSRRSMRMAHS
jgi:hypothetical protein